MKGLRLLSALAVMASAYGCAESPAAPAPAPALSTLSGTVTEVTDTGVEPVSGVLVVDGASSKSTTTDERGRYSLVGLRAADSIISSTKAGYLSDRRPVTINGATRLDIEVARDQPYTLSGVTFEVTEAGRIPVAGVSLYCDGCGESGHTGLTTDADGFYLFPFVYPTVQYLQVGKIGYRTVLPSALPGIPVTVKGHTRFDIQFVRE